MAGIDAFTKLMLHCNGTDNSTVFVDSSLTPKSPVANIDAKIKIDQSKFGGASGRFGSSSSGYVSLVDSPDWAFGTGDFTIDLWVRFFNSNGNQSFCGRFTGGSSYFYFAREQATGTLRFRDYSGGDNINIQAAWSPVANQWYHIAAVRASGVIKLYVDGVPLTLSTNTGAANSFVARTDVFTVGSNPGIGYNVNGWIDEFRVSKGVARWTADFSASLPTSEYSGYDSQPLNPSFETWSSPGVPGVSSGVCDNWTNQVGGSGTPGIVYRSSTPSPNGGTYSAALQIFAGGANSSLAGILSSTFIPTNPTLSIWLKSTVQSQCSVNFYVNGVAQGSVTFATAVGTDWTQFTFNITSYLGTNFTFDVGIYSSIGQASTVLVDNVLAFVTQRADVKNDVRFSKLSRQDIINDFRMRVLTPASGDVKSDFRLHSLSTRDVFCDIRTTDHVNAEANIKGDVRFRYALSYNDIRNIFTMVRASLSDISNDIRMKIGGFGVYNVGQDFRTVKLFTRDFTCRAVVGKESVIDKISMMTEVYQNEPVQPTGLTALNMEKGDLVRLQWNSDTNYGYNVYRLGSYIKLNQTPVFGTEYFAGNLTPDQPYQFVIRGVNGVGAESIDSLVVSCTPTFPNYAGGASRVVPYTYQVKVNGVARTDAIVSTVELAYGSTPNVARFTIPSDPFAPGLPTHDDEIEVIINSRSIFKGIVKNIEKSITSNGMALSYVAYSKVFNRTLEPVTWDYILQIREQFDIDVADQHWLQAYETVANFKGNYRLFYNMDTDVIEEYKLGTGNVNRSFVVGKNVLEWNITEDTTSNVKKVTVRGNRRKVRVGWTSLSMPGSYEVGKQGNTTIFIRKAGLGAFNIGDIQVEAYQSEGAPEIRYYPDKSIVPTDVPIIANYVPSGGVAKWKDGTVEPKQVVEAYFNPVATWRSAGVSVEYHYTQVGNEQIPTSASITMTSSPMLTQADIGMYWDCVRKGRPGKNEDVDFGFCMVAFDNVSSWAPLRISYSYEEQLPTEVSTGTGLPARSVTDTQYSPYDDGLSGVYDTQYVKDQMQVRAENELEKMNRPIVSGRIQVIGDETISLKTMVEVEGQALDIIRVTHNFNRGFTTDIELTNEKFRVNIPPYQDMRKRIDYERRIVGVQSQLQDLQRKMSQQALTAYTQQKTVKDIPKSPFAVYGD